jgi:hypothetical protein
LNRTLIIAVAAAGVAVAVAAAASGRADTGPGTIRITDLQTDYRLLPGSSSGAGATEIARLTLYNRRITNRPIGHADLLCTFLTGTARTCTATYFLPKGKIVVGGAIGSRLIYQAAVVGGTGLYDNARGTLTVTSTDFRPRREILLFRLAG